MFPALLTAVLWTLSAACSARSARHLGGTRANRWRLTIALALVGTVMLLVGRGTWNQAAWWLVLSGVAGLGLGDLALFGAYQRLGARIPALLTHCLGTPMAALLEWQFLGNALHLSEALWIAVILSGVVLALWPEREPVRESAPTAAPASGIPLGLFLSVLSAAGLAMAAVLSRTGYAAAKDLGQALPWLDATVLRIVGGLGLCLLWLPVPGRGPTIKPDWRRGWPWLIGTAVFGPAIGVAMYQWALSIEKAGIVQAVIALVPVAIIPLTRWTEGDRPSWRAIIGGIIGVAGVIGMALTR